MARDGRVHRLTVESVDPVDSALPAVSAELRPAS